MFVIHTLSYSKLFIIPSKHFWNHFNLLLAWGQWNKKTDDDLTETSVPSHY